MAHLPWMEASVEGPIPGCNRLQICGLFAQFCRDLPSYLVDIVDVTMSPVQFETRHPPHLPILLALHCVQFCRAEECAFYPLLAGS